MSKHLPTYVHEAYFSNINPEFLKERISKARKFLKHVDFDTIAFMGMSGALLAPPLAMALGKELIMVRKPGRTHSKKRVEGNAGSEKYIIVDDFMESGKTARIIRDMVKDFAPKAVLIGVHEMHRHYKYEGWNRYKTALTPMEE